MSEVVLAHDELRTYHSDSSQSFESRFAGLGLKGPNYVRGTDSELDELVRELDILRFLLRMTNPSATLNRAQAESLRGFVEAYLDKDLSCEQLDKLILSLATWINSCTGR